MATEKQMLAKQKHDEEMERRRIIKAAEKAARRAENRARLSEISDSIGYNKIDHTEARRLAITKTVVWAQDNIDDLLSELLDLTMNEDANASQLQSIKYLIDLATGQGKFFTGPKQLAAAMKGLTVEEQYAKVRELYTDGMIPEEQSKALLAIVEAADKSESRDLRARLAAAEAKIEFYETGQIIPGEAVPNEPEEQGQVTHG